MKLNYVNYFENIDFLSGLKLDDKNKNIIIFSKNYYKISDNIKVFKSNNINKFPIELSCLINLLSSIKNEDFYFLDFNQNNIERFLNLKLDDNIFKNNYCFLNQDSKDDVSICLANYRDKILFSTKYDSVMGHGFPLIINGKDLIFILRFLKISFDINIFNYNIEGIFAILLKMKHG